MKKILAVVILVAMCSISVAARPATATIKRFAGEQINGLSAAGAFNIVIRQGYFTGLSVEVPDDKKDFLTAELTSDGIVNLEYKPEGNNFKGISSVKVILTCTTLEELRAYGVSSILLDDFIDTHNINIDLKGVSKIENTGRLIVGTDMNLTAEGTCKVRLGEIIANSVDLNIAGVSAAELEGSVSRVKVEVSGISRASLSRLRADDTMVSTRGLGRVLASSYK